MRWEVKLLTGGRSGDSFVASGVSAIKCSRTVDGMNCCKRSWACMVLGEDHEDFLQLLDSVVESQFNSRPPYL